MHATIKHFGQQLDHFESDPAKAEREHIRAQQHHRAHFCDRERRANSTGMTSHEIPLQITKLIVRNVNLGKFSETGADAINNRIPRHDFFNDAPRLFDPGSRRLAKSGPARARWPRRRSPKETAAGHSVRASDCNTTEGYKKEKARPMKQPGL